MHTEVNYWDLIELFLNVYIFIYRLNTFYMFQFECDLYTHLPLNFALFLRFFVREILTFGISAVLVLERVRVRVLHIMYP